MVENNEPTGKLIALQIKTGASYFRPKGENRKTFISDGIANDDESIRRFNMAFDLDTIEMLNGKEVYFEVNEWVNQSLDFRDVGVYFDTHGKEKPDFMIRIQVNLD